MNSRTVTQNGTYNHDKQANQNTKVHRHWVQEALNWVQEAIYIYISNFNVNDLLRMQPWQPV